MAITVKKHAKVDIKKVLSFSNLLDFYLNYTIYSGIIIVNFDHVSQLFSSVSVVEFEQVNASWEVNLKGIWFHQLGVLSCSQVVQVELITLSICMLF